MTLLKTSIIDDVLAIHDLRNNDSISLSLLQSSLMYPANRKIKVLIWDDGYPNFSLAFGAELQRQSKKF